MPSTSFDFSIVTPSLNMLGYLKRCGASVADQDGVSVEHMVMDACSTDGTVKWLLENERVISSVEKDKGMYDAVNKGFRRARGRILAYLNCDEQYLPGTLAYVKDFFDSHPQIDLLFGGGLVVRPDGSLIAYRKAYQPRWPYISVSHLYVMSCTMFVRRRVIERGFLFDDNLRANGDERFVVVCLRNGFRAAYAKRYFSAFTMTGSNMSAGENAKREQRELLKATPLWVRVFWHPLNVLRLTEKTLAGAYRESFPLTYTLYDSDDLEKRRKFVAAKASFRWKTG